MNAAPMFARVGIELTASDLRVALVRGGSVVWTRHCPRRARESAADAVADALTAMPRAWPRPPVAIALGPSLAQVKVLTGLPNTRDVKLLAQAARENADRFFLRPRGQLAVTSIERRASGESWGAACDASLIDAVTSGVERVGYRLQRALPSLIALAVTAADGDFLWDDGGVRVRARVAGGLLRSSEWDARDAALEEQRPSLRPQARAALASLGEEAWRFAPALGAAIAPRGLAPSWVSAMTDARRRRSRLTRNAVLAVLLGSTTVAAAAAPGVRAARYAQAARAQLPAAVPMEAVVAQADRQLRDASLVLAQVEHFRSGARSSLLLLGEITQALPESTAVVSFRADTLEGTAVIVSPHVVDVLPELGHLEHLHAPRIIGVVTREQIGVARLERATIRFRIAREPAPRPAPPGAK